MTTDEEGEAMADNNEAAVLTQFAVVRDVHESVVGVKEAPVNGVLLEDGVVREGPYAWLTVEQGAVPPPWDAVVPGRAIALLSVRDAQDLIIGLQTFVDAAQ